MLFNFRHKHTEKEKPNIDYFFIRGFQRSGTNWIGNLLNLHPEIYVTGEFHFEMLKTALYSLPIFSTSPISTESGLMNNIDRSYEKLVKDILIISSNAPKEIKWLGDRTPYRLEPAIKNKPTFYIFRDGRDILISWTFHIYLRGMQLLRRKWKSYPLLEKGYWNFQKDNYFFQQHPERLLLDKKWVQDIAANWTNNVEPSLELIKNSEKGIHVPNIFIIRYEDLHTKTKEIRDGMYQFLGVSPQKAKPLSKLTTAGFNKEDFTSHYRKGCIGDWKNYFGPETCSWFKEKAGNLLLDLGYENDNSWSNDI